MSRFLTVDQAIGQRLREVRLELGLRQDQVAEAAARVGLGWTQSTVAAIEGGNRALSLGEWFLLSTLIGHATGFVTHQFELAELLPASGRVALSDETSADVEVLRAALAGRLTDPDRKPLADFDTPFSRRTRETFRRFSGEMKRLARLWGNKMSLRDYETARDAARGDAERKAARRLGVPPLDLSVAAHGRYGRSFSDERDHRVAEQAPDGAAPRTLQALRGHVTRAMVAELAPALEQWRQD
jgi:transcriptional regulator with XRE-family HTH domain